MLQSASTEHVNSNIDRISKITYESASGAQQSARACQELSGLALDLQKVVGQFKLSHNGQGNGNGHGVVPGASRSALSLPNGALPLHDVVRNSNFQFAAGRN